MLVLTRKPEQVVTIGDPRSPIDAIDVKVIEVRGDQVRLGITAPENVVVDRKEIWLEKREQSAAV